MTKISSDSERSELPIRIEVDSAKYEDELTGLKNREWLNQHLPEEVDNHPGEVALLMLDLNGFKQINDTFGHDVGNEHLKRTARILTGRVLDEQTRRDKEDRRGDTIRLSGDEFLVVLYGIDPEGLEAVRIRIESALDASDISASIGAVMHQKENAKEFLKKADDAMYRAKQETKEASMTDEQWQIIEQMGSLAVKGKIIPRDFPLLLAIHEARKSQLPE